MKTATKRLIVASTVIASSLLIYWLSGLPWVRGPDAAFVALCALLVSFWAASYPFKDDQP